MSVNFGYNGYGMNNMNMMNGVGFTGMNSGGTFQSIASQCSCPICYQQGPIPYNYQTNVNPLPRQSFNHSWLARFFGRIFG